MNKSYTAGGNKARQEIIAKMRPMLKRAGYEYGKAMPYQRCFVLTMDSRWNKRPGGLGRGKKKK